MLFGKAERKKGIQEMDISMWQLLNDNPPHTLFVPAGTVSYFGPIPMGCSLVFKHPVKLSPGRS